MRKKEILSGYLFIMPFLVLFVIFLGYPIISSFILSMHKTTIYSDWYNKFSDMKFIGAQHYVNLVLHDKEFWWSLLASIIYGLLTIPTSIITSLLLAVVLNGKIRGASIYRSAFFMPFVFDMFVVGVIWTFLYAPKYGIIDILLNKIGITALSANGLLGNSFLVLPAVALAVVLKGMGFGMILYLTTIQTIPRSIYEAAEVDGASWFQKLWNITVPLVKPITIFMVIMGIIGCLNAFTEIFAMTNNTGGPSLEFAGETVRVAKISGYYLYRTFDDGFYGKAAAVSFLLLGIAVLISVTNLWVSKRGKTS